MLNWRIEEEEYIHKKLEEYKEPFLFCLFNNNKHLNEFVKNARLEYRRMKLDKFLSEVEEERKRIDSLVEDMNNKFEVYMNKQKGIICKYNKPFKLKLSEGEYRTLEPTEIVTVQLEPFELAFIREKVD